MKRISEVLRLELGYRFNEVDVKRPWGGYFRIADRQIDRFLDDFFPGHSKQDVLMGTKLSPKIMVVLPGQRFSWQYHDRRAERWHFLTTGIYWRGKTDEIPDPIEAKAGEIVQFEQGERHRGGAPKDAFVLIAEIWQHSDAKHLSDEADVYRIQDDYKRPKHPRRA